METQDTTDPLPGLALAERQLARWRATHLTGTRIPDRLWRTAADLANVHGLSCTARVLGLDYNRLKERVALASRSDAEPTPNELSDGSTSVQVNAAPGFVEFFPANPQVTQSCVIEIDSENDTTLRLDLKGYAPTELGAILRTIWRPSR